MDGDYPAVNTSFTYIAHFYRTDNLEEESSRALKEFEQFFREIGYEYDYSGDVGSRWFEGLGVKIR